MKRGKHVFNAQEAASFLGAHVETVRRLARRDELPAFKVGKDWRFRREALLRWAEGHHLRRRPPCVLVVDDEESVRNLVGQFLAADGCNVRLAADGVEGLARLNGEVVDLVLLDLKMPGMNGPEFLRELRRRNENLPVIVLTGYPDSDLMVEAMRHGPFTLLAKPVEGELLVRAVRSALNGSRDTHVRPDRTPLSNGG
jgi:excisionase family DNA binding protein